MKKNYFVNLFFLFFSLAANVMAAHSLPLTSIPDPCATGILALINRPSLTGSACVMPKKQIMVEGGYQYFNLGGNAHGYITPQAEIRFGLPDDNEFVLIAPSFYHQTIPARAGWSAPILSLKHEFGYDRHWVTAIEGLLTIPTGSENYGSRSFSGAINVIATYAFGPVFSLSGTLGIMSQSVQYIQNGKRFTSINPDVIASWQLNDRLLLFAELNSQTRTGAGEGFGLISDAGVFYLPSPHISLDAELGQRITGAWGFQSYVGAGFGFLFG